MPQLVVRCLLAALAGTAIGVIGIDVAGVPYLIVLPTALVVGILIGLM